MSEKITGHTVKVSASEEAFLKENGITFSDVWHYAMLHLMRGVLNGGVPRCIYISIQSRASVPRAEKIFKQRTMPRTCSCCVPYPLLDPAALAHYNCNDELVQGQSNSATESICEGFKK